VDRIARSHDVIMGALAEGRHIYGVTSGFGGMAHVRISKDEAAELQKSLIRFLKTGTGDYLPIQDVRTSMLLRIDSHLQGGSGIRMCLIERMAIFLNASVTPLVREHGSIGASGDLVPLATMTGALIGEGLSYKVDYQGEHVNAQEALFRLGLKPISLLPKEGLAMVNGTSVSTGIAANVWVDSLALFSVLLHIQALMFQALGASTQSFHPLIQRYKPHPGQLNIAKIMNDYLKDSKLVRHERAGGEDRSRNDLIQDRYSLRCFAQYFAPMIDAYRQWREDLEIEMNSATDNPLIDPDTGDVVHGGNFLSQYVSITMDQLRYFQGLAAKHLDVQIAMLVTPEMSGGLPGSLADGRKATNMGLKGLQISSNSLLPLLNFYGNSMADRFPTHAEQFNQNINSQSFNSAMLARKSIGIFQQMLAIATIFGVQGVEHRAKMRHGSYDPREYLSQKPSHFTKPFIRPSIALLQPVAAFAMTTMIRISKG
jgi:phenylalanine ammonia-lyase